MDPTITWSEPWVGVSVIVHCRHLFGSTTVPLYVVKLSLDVSVRLFLDEINI